MTIEDREAPARCRNCGAWLPQTALECPGCGSPREMQMSGIAGRPIPPRWLVIGGGLAVTGVGLLAILGLELLGQPWLLAALSLYALNLVVAALISRPNLRRLLRIGADGDAEAWRRRARRQRYLAYGMAAATGLIGFLMSTKPGLW